MDSSIEYEKTIIFCVIGDKIEHQFLRSWTEIVGYCIINKIKPVLSTRNVDNFVSKTQLLMPTSETNAPFGNKIEYDYVIFISTSAICSIDSLKSILGLNKDIVSGFSLNKTNLEKTNYIVNFDHNNGENNNYDEVENAKRLLNNDKKLIKVDYVDFNLVCIKSGVLEQIKLPWFNYDGKTNDITGEVYFCNKCKENGIDILVNLETFIPCEKKLIY
tara:strand:+ start:25493 stop:26143 length:651 start_codon:yes stop_codon:yes gene_type:complete